MKEDEKQGLAMIERGLKKVGGERERDRMTLTSHDGEKKK